MARNLMLLGLKLCAILRELTAAAKIPWLFRSSP
jgi:hypothetical protein